MTNNIRRTRILLPVLVLVLTICSQADTIKLKVTGKNGVVRFKPEFSSRILVSLTQGSTLDAESLEGEWYFVSVISPETGYLMTGYIHADSVEEVLREKRPVIAQNAKTISKETEPAPQPKKSSPEKTAEGLPGHRFGFKLIAGYVFTAPEDINDGISGSTAFYRAGFEQISPNIDISGSPRPIKSGFQLEGALEIALFSSLRLELGGGYFRSSQKTELSAKRIFYNYESTVVQHPKITLIPLTLTIRFHFPLEKHLNFNLFIGSGYAFAWYSDTKEISAVSGLTETWERRNIRAKATGLGFHTGFGMEFRLSPSLFFIIEGGGRLMRIKDFNGEVTVSDNTGLSKTEEGTLYSYSRWYPHGMYPFTDLFPQAPAGDDDFNVRKTEIDLSGMTFSAGFKFRF